MTSLNARIQKMLLSSVDVWSSCGCESYEWSLKDDIEFDVVDTVVETLRSDAPTMRWLASELGLSVEQVEIVITRFLDEAVRTQTTRRQIRKISA